MEPFLITFIILSLVFLGLWVATLRKQMKDLALGKDQSWEVIFKNSPQPMAIFDFLETKLVSANPQMYRSFPRMSERNLVLDDFFGTGFQKDNFIQTLSNNGQVFGMEVELQADTGTPGWFLASASLFDFQQRRSILLTLVDIAFQKDVEGILQRNNSFLEALLTGSPDPVLYTNNQGKIAGFNRAFIDFFQVPEDRFLGRTVIDFWPMGEPFPPDRTLLRKMKQKTVPAFQKDFDIEGRVRHVLISRGVFLGPENEPEGMILILKDVTLLKNIQDELIRRDRFLQALAKANSTLIQTSEPEEGLLGAFESLGKSFDAQSVVLIQTDENLDSGYLDLEWNSGKGSLFRSKDIPLGKLLEEYPFLKTGKEESLPFGQWPGLTDVLDSSLDPVMDLLILPVMVEKKLHSLVVMLARNLGPGWTTTEKNLIGSFSNSVANLLKESQSRQEIIQARANLGAFMDNAQGYFAALDLEGKFLALNHSFQELFLREYGEIPQLGLTIQDLMAPEDYKIWGLRLNKARGEQSLTFEWESGLGVVLTSLSPIRGEEHILGTAIMGTNINDRIEIEKAYLSAKEEAERANRAKGAFLANMSHEIRTPLNAVLGFSDLLSEMTENSLHRSYLDTIRSSAKNLLMLINDILDISKMEAGHMSLEEEFIQVEEVCRDVVKLFEFRADRNKVLMSFQTEGLENQSIYLDEVRFRQILFNLLGNAVKFTESGEIVVYLEMKKALEDSTRINLSLVVKDTGTGIPEQDLERIFEAFQQKEGQSVKKFGGTGLGLSITKKLVELMEGQISVVSKENIGSVFTVELPFRQYKSLTTKREEKPRNRKIRFSGSKVLIAEDNKTDRLLLREFLKPLGLELILVENGVEAYEALKEKTPDMILMDLKMPDMGGKELLQKAMDQRLSVPPLIIVSADHPDQVKESCLGLPVSEFLSKPLERALLVNTMARFLPHNLVDEDHETSGKKLALKDILTIKDRAHASWKSISQKSLSSGGKNNMRFLSSLGKEIETFGGNAQNENLAQWGRNLSDKASQFNVAVVKSLFRELMEVVQDNSGGKDRE